MASLLLIGQLAFAAFALGADPLSKRKYESEHPKLGGLNALETQISQGSFFETFQYESDEDFRNNWVTSNLEMERTDDTMAKAFPGLWKLETPYLVPGFIDDHALVLGSANMRAAIAHKLEEPISVNDGEKLVIQYEVKLQKVLECGGAYIKLLNTNETDFSQYDYSSEDYALVFGPDACGMYTNEIHLVLKRQNPITGELEDKFLTDAPISGLDQPITRLYTLILDSKDQSYEIRLDGKVVKSGSLLDEGVFSPPLNPAKEIDDPTAVRPSNWDDRELIPDPNAQKPDEWDETQPEWIVDPTVKKPEEWDENIPEYISAPSATQPDWWNEEKDGRWIAPLIRNPSCSTEKGCGAWKPKMIKNERYVGEWAPPLIENPAYQGEWTAPKIPNADFFEDTRPANVENITAVAFDIWSSSSDISFDNLYIGKSVEEAERIGNATFIPKIALEEKEVAAVNEKAANEKGQSQHVPPSEYPSKEDEPVDFIQQLTNRLDSSETLQRFIAWFLSIDDLYKGFFISTIMVVVVVITGIGMIRFMVWAQGIDNASGPSRPSVRRTPVEAEEQPVEVKITEEKDASFTTATGYKISSSELLSKRIVQQPDGSDYEEQLEISVVEETEPSISEANE